MLTPDDLATLAGMGLSGEQLSKVLEIISRVARDDTARKAADAARKRRSRDRHRDTPSDGHCDSHADGHVTVTGPPSCARGGDKPLDSEGPCSSTLLCSDWPTSTVVECLVGAVASPRLDLAKSPGLITTAGIIGRWKAAGVSWDTVVTVVKGKAAPPGGPITSWKYFEQAVLQLHADIAAPVSLPTAQGNVVRLSFSEREAERRAAIKARVIAEMDKENGQHRS